MVYIKERYQNFQLDLEDRFCLLSIEGKDAEAFLAGQLTSHVHTLADGNFQPTARLDRRGRLTAYGYLLRRAVHVFYLLIEREMAVCLADDLEKYIIMEDVKVDTFKEPLGVEWLFGRVDGGFVGYFWGQWARILVGTPSSLPVLERGLCHTIRRLGGFPIFDEMVLGRLIVESYLNEVAVDYGKGCFLGQETAAKIHNNRGAAAYPVLIRTDGPVDFERGSVSCDGRAFGEATGRIEYGETTFLTVNVKREFRIDKKHFRLTVGGESFGGVLLYLPLFGDKTLEQKAHELYAVAVGHFKRGEEGEAIDLLESIITSVPEFPDAYESLGVILGRQGRYEEAVVLMDRLLEVDGSSVMAHTNKSLYFMKMGRIEEAEEEKARATVESFRKLGKEAQDKKNLEERKEHDRQERRRKEGMFREVLAIDAEDPLANYGLGEIALDRGDYTEAKNFLEIVLKINAKHSRAYLLLGRAWEAMGNAAKARELYTEGIGVAAKAGDMAVANEMQERLLKLG